jgi:transketolase
MRIVQKLTWNTRVVSMPCLNLFAQQSSAYKDSILNNRVPTVVIEAGHPSGWYEYVGEKRLIIGIDRFGWSGKEKDILETAGFTVEKITNQINVFLEGDK